MPVYLLDILINWHLKLNGRVIWQGALSAVFHVKSGVRQGGVLSPWFFNLYVNDLIVHLKLSGLGCYLSHVFVGCIFFADDILLLSGSLLQLQCMLDICYDYGLKFDILFNSDKSFLLQIGLVDHHSLPSLALGLSCLKWVDKIKYLGVWIVAGKRFHVDCTLSRTKFLGAVFGVLQKCGGISEEIKWNVLCHSCLPVLTYMVSTR